MYIPECPSFIHIHSEHAAAPIATNREKPEHILIARLATDLLAWIDSAWIIGLIRTHDAADVIGVFNESGDPALWAGYVESITTCARAETPASVDSQLRGHNLARILFPIETDGPVTVVLAIGPRNQNHNQPYSASDVSVMRDLCDQIGNLLRGYTTAIPANDELDVVRGIQDRLLPASLPNVAGIECSGHCERSGRLGGDFFEFSGSDSTGLLAAIGNVATEGSPGCILMTGLQACLRSLGRRGVELPDLLADLNRMFWETAPENAYAELFCAHIDPRGERLSFINAGHRTSLIVRSSGRIERLEPNAAVLGLGRGTVYRQRTVSFEPGDTLIALSDGITEPGCDRAMIEMVQPGRGTRVHELPARILEMLKEMLKPDLVEASAGPQVFDRTVVVVRFKGPSRIDIPFARPVVAAA
jgi:hypothetical protein